MLSRVSGSRLMWNADEVIHLRLRAAGLGPDVTRLGEAKFELGDPPPLHRNHNIPHQISISRAV